MKNMQDAVNDFRQVSAQIAKLESRVPAIIGNIALDTIEKNFDNESYDTGNGKIKWEPRKESTNKAYDKRYGVKGSVYSSSAPILNQTGDLKDAIRKRVAARSVFIGFDTKKIPYGEVHNEGDPAKNIPQRQFMPREGEPENTAIMKRVYQKVRFEHEKILRPYKL